MSRRARAVELWATLMALGRSGVAGLIEDLQQKAVYFADCLRQAGFTVLNEVCFNQVLVTSGDPRQAVSDLVTAGAHPSCPKPSH